MKPLKRKDSCTFKRETSLDNQERIYQLQKPIASSGGFISPPGGITYPDLSGKLAA
jgi:hypothetical protein